MNPENTTLLHNTFCTLQIDLKGGAFVDFRLSDSDLNPLNFRMLQEGSFHEPFYYQGHFLCLGRWGDPSPNELKKGLNKHGEFVRLEWTAEAGEQGLTMQAGSQLEGLSLIRNIELSRESACFKVTEQVRNINPIGRPYQMVQHPSLGRPFLSEDTVVECNSNIGFDYAFPVYDASIFTSWPEVKTVSGEKIRLDHPVKPYSSVFPFTIKPEDQYGWIAAWSPSSRLMLGYLWKREDYPWINHWLHWEEDEGKMVLKYRGMEFGNSGIHKPFPEIFSEGLVDLLGERNLTYIDADEVHTRSYYSFLFRLPENFKGVEEISLKNSNLLIREKANGNILIIPHNID